MAPRKSPQQARIQRPARRWAGLCLMLVAVVLLAVGRARTMGPLRLECCCDRQKHGCRWQ